MKKLIILILVCVPAGIFAQESPGVYKVKNDKINNSYADLATTFLGNNKVVFASPNKDLTYNKDEYSSKGFLEPDMGEITEDDRLFIKENLLNDTDSYLGQGMVTFSKDRKTVFFSVNRKIKNNNLKNEKEVKTRRAVYLRLFKANINENGEWVNLEMLPFNSNHYSTGQPYLNQDDTKLYFVSDGPESLGRTDIFVVDLHEDGTYGKPVNLGPKINSREREIFPYIDKDNLLYFSSDVSNQRGDLDVFACKIFDNTISTPVKLKGPVNIDKDGFAYNIDDEKYTGYFSSNKLEGKGVEDIYAFIDSSPINTECQQEISGIVKNVATQELLPNVQIMLFDKNDKKIVSFLSNEMDASFSFRQSCNSTYKLKGYLEGYLIGEMDIKTVNDLNAEPLEIVMNMSVDHSMNNDLIVNVPEAMDTEDMQVGVSTVEIPKVAVSDKKSILSSHYNFNSDNKVYTVQIGAFKGNAQTHKFIKLSSLFNHLYNDGFNRYYSGIFESHSEALDYMKLLKKDGYFDAFVVGLKGEKRF
jgi:sporulation related protein/WD40 repeat protein